MIETADELRRKIINGRANIEKARWYLNSPNANVYFGSARLEQLMSRQRELLEQARTYRLQTLKELYGII